MKNKKDFTRNLKREWPLHAMMLLPVIFLFVFQYIPLGGIVIAFQDYKPAKGIGGSKWVGLENFIEVFTTPNFSNALQNTLIIAVVKILLDIIVPVSFALLLNEMRCSGVKRTVQTMVYLPHFLSWVLLSGIFVEILSPHGGLVNQIITFFGGKSVFFLGSNAWFRPILWITDVWKDFGYSTIIYLAALTSIDPGLYEAASLDGAGHMRKMWHITLTGIRPTIILMATLKIGSVLNAGFDQVFNLYSPVVYETGDIIDTLVYRLGLGGGNFSLSTAVSLFKSTISGSLLLLAYKIAYKVSGYHVF